MRVLGGGAPKDPDLADALVCDVLSITYADLQATPERVIAYRMTLARERERMRKASQPLQR